MDASVDAARVRANDAARALECVDANASDARCRVYAPRARRGVAETRVNGALTLNLSLADDDAPAVSRADRGRRARGKENERLVEKRAGAVDGGDDARAWRLVDARDADGTRMDADDARRARNRRSRLARVVVEQWMWFVERGRGVAAARARAVRERWLTRRATRAWAEAAREARRRWTRAGIYRHLGMKQRAFDAWRVCADDDRARARESRARACLERWRAVVEARREAALERERTLERLSAYHDWTRIVGRALRDWRRACAPEIREARARAEFCDRYARKTLMKRTLVAWREASTALMDERANAIVAASFDEVKTCAKALRAWRCAVKDGDREREEKAATFQSYVSVNRLAEAFSAWVDLSREARKTLAQKSTPAKVRAGRTRNALYQWLFNRPDEREAEIQDFLDELEARTRDRVDDEEDVEAAVAEYEELREHARRLLAEAKALQSGTSPRTVARRRVLRSTAEHLRRRREELLPFVRRAVSGAEARTASVRSSSFGLSELSLANESEDEIEDEIEDESEDESEFLKRKYF